MLAPTVMSNDSQAIIGFEYEEVTIEKISYVGKTGHWSKWGGRRYSLIDSQNAEVSDVWYCQSCNSPQPKDLSPMKFEYPITEYIRVCAICYADGCLKLLRRVKSENL